MSNNQNQTIEGAILCALHYFEFFKHPLKREELLRYCHIAVSPAAFNLALEQLVKQSAIIYSDGYYALSGKMEHIRERRRFESLNKRMLKQARWVSYLLRNIPFTRSISISGSLSKLGASTESDIDFFVITARNRVWIVKAIAILIKKLLFLNSYKYLCINYLLDEDHLELKKQNRFQAIEAISLIPLYGRDGVAKLHKVNPWIGGLFPNYKVENTKDERLYFQPVKRLSEFLLNGAFGDKIEQWAKLRFLLHGRAKWSATHREKARLEYRNGVSVYFPNDFEERVLDNYRVKTRNLHSIPS